MLIADLEYFNQLSREEDPIGGRFSRLFRSRFLNLVAIRRVVLSTLPSLPTSGGEVSPTINVSSTQTNENGTVTQSYSIVGIAGRLSSGYNYVSLRSTSSSSSTGESAGG